MNLEAQINKQNLSNKFIKVHYFSVPVLLPVAAVDFYIFKGKAFRFTFVPRFDFNEEAC